MAAEEVEKPQDFKRENPTSTSNPLIVILLVSNAILMGAVAFLQYSAHQKTNAQQSVSDIVKAEMANADKEKSKSGGPTGEAVEEDGKPFPLDSFTSNLAQGDGPRRFLRINLVLKFSMDSNEEEYRARKPQIRDTIISILNSKRPEDVLKMEGKNYLKEEIKAGINAFLVDGKCIDVYYVGFQVS